MLLWTAFFAKRCCELNGRLEYRTLTRGRRERDVRLLSALMYYMNAHHDDTASCKRTILPIMSRNVKKRGTRKAE